MGADQSSGVAAAAEQLRGSASVAELLSLTAEALVVVLDAPACTISRVIGDLLVDLVQHRREGSLDRLGHGYLISDYPLTRAVIENLEAKTVYSGDADADARETSLLGELGFDSLLMLPIEAEGAAWGLVEVYASGRRFEAADVDAAKALATEAGEKLVQLSRPAP
ncbi:MAG: GAF domain-containing protein [Gaiellaceae bacterium]